MNIYFSLDKESPKSINCNKEFPTLPFSNSVPLVEQRPIVKKMGKHKRQSILTRKELVAYFINEIEMLPVDEKVDSNDLMRSVGRDAYKRLKKIYESKEKIEKPLANGRLDEVIMECLSCITLTLYKARVLRYPVSLNRSDYKKRLITLLKRLLSIKM